jgi:hypothetical protein
LRVGFLRAAVVCVHRRRGDQYMDNTLQDSSTTVTPTAREQALQDKLGSRTLLLVLVSLVALVELLVILRLTV